MPHVQLLLGPNATSAMLRSALNSKPEMVHFAVHVLSAESAPEHAALALALTSRGIPELLTSEGIAQYSVPGALIVMNACSSDQGAVLPSSGVMGLSRAWLLSGATSVVVSSWLLPENTANFFDRFYDPLQGDFSATSAALALRAAQLDMMKQRDFRRSPAFWAAYSVISRQ